MVAAVVGATDIKMDGSEMSGPSAPFYSFDKKDADAFPRLGAALIYLWDGIPKEIQEVLLAQSVLIESGSFPNSGTHAERRVATLKFIDAHKRDKFNQPVSR